MNMREIVQRDRLMQSLALARVQAQKIEQQQAKASYIAQNGREPVGLSMWSATGVAGLKRYL
jgi:hypothetical protein